MNMKLSIVIVNYNVSHFLEQCLRSVLIASQNIETEIVVVDNDSNDDSLSMLTEKFPQIRCIANKVNVGFAKANNQAIRELNGEYVLLLNPDTLVEEDTFEKCIRFFEDTPDAGSIGVKMINGKGEFLPESKRALPVPAVAFYKIFGLSKLFPHSHRFGSYHLTYLDKNENHSVEVLSGAFMMIRKSVLNEIGLLDEDFFMYGEDIDLSYRIIQAGYKNYYFSGTNIIHYKGESTKKNSVNYVLVFYKAMKIFVQKHFAKKRTILFNFIINFAIAFRASLAIIRRLLGKIALPIFDFAVIYAGMLVLAKYWENAVLIHRHSSFPTEFSFLFIPAFILIWILAIACCKGYKSPYSLQKTNRGLIFGIIIIFLIYALLPENLRFSRAVILFGAMWAALAMNSIRYILHKMHIKSFNFVEDDLKKVVVVGKPDEASRAAKLSMMTEKKLAEIIHLNVLNFANDQWIERLKSLVQQKKINRIVFCSNDLKIKDIIFVMSELQSSHVEFLIMPADDEVLIASDMIFEPLILKSAD